MSTYILAYACILVQNEFFVLLLADVFAKPFTNNIAKVLRDMHADALLWHCL